MKRNRHEPEPPRAEPWNPDQWVPDEPEPAPEPEPEPEPIVVEETPAEPVEETPLRFRPPRDSQVSVVPQPSAEEPGAGQLHGQPPAPGRNTKRLIAAAGAGIAVLGIAGAIAAAAMPSSTDGRPVAEATSTASSTSAEPVVDDCPTSRDGKVTRGRDAGDQKSGPGVIKAFDHAYYVERDGAKARSFGTPAAKMGTADQMKNFIKNELPEGTRHCLVITDESAGQYAVELAQIPPGGGEPKIIRQRVQTTQDNGKYWIVSIEPIS